MSSRSYYHSTKSTWGSKEINAVTKLFDNYKDENDEEELILTDGIVKLLNDLEISDDDIKTYLMVWKMNCQELGQITKEEFLKGFEEFRVTTIDGLKKSLVKLENEIHKSGYKKFYSYCFDLVKDSDKKLLDIEVAIGLWNTILKDKFIHYDLWLKFLQDTNVKSINKDSFTVLYDFATKIDGNMENYDETDAWPSILDSFVEYAKPLLQSK